MLLESAERVLPSPTLHSEPAVMPQQWQVGLVAVVL